MHSTRAALALRLGLAFVFLYFGVDKFFHPQAWFVWVPSWMLNATPENLQNPFMYAQGAAETLLGLGLLLGVWLRTVTILSGLLLLWIVLLLNIPKITDVGVRDVGLLAAIVALYSLSPPRERAKGEGGKRPVDKLSLTSSSHTA